MAEPPNGTARCKLAFRTLFWMTSCRQALGAHYLLSDWDPEPAFTYAGFSLVLSPKVGVGPNPVDWPGKGHAWSLGRLIGLDTKEAWHFRKVPNCSIIQFKPSSLCVFIFLHCWPLFLTKKTWEIHMQVLRTHFEVYDLRKLMEKLWWPRSWTLSVLGWLCLPRCDIAKSFSYVLAYFFFFLFFCLFVCFLFCFLFCLFWGLVWLRLSRQGFSV